MRRSWEIFALLAMILCLGISVSAAGPGEISSRAELEAIAGNPGGDYILTDNIDMGPEPWTPIPFYGTLDGDGYTIYNLRIVQPGAETAVSVDGNRKPYDTRYAGLFSVVREAAIRHLNILGAEVDIDCEDNCFAAILAGYLKDTEILDCQVEGRVHMTGRNKMVGTGGVAGFGRGSLRDCRADVELAFEDVSSGIRCEQFMGGILACGNGGLTGNTVTIRGWDYCKGYVHNGGLVGMYYCYDEAKPGEICNNDVKGKITFLEDNPNRRAYCEAFGGELLSQPNFMEGNTQDFVRDEQWTKTRALYPNPCENPGYTRTEVPADCEHWGYTLWKCRTCDYSYRTGYQPPSHDPGPWEVSREPDREHGGEETRSCLSCGKVLESRPLPALKGPESCTLSPKTMKLKYRELGVLHPEILPQNVGKVELTWTSSDESVATVDENGIVAATGRGQATITCRAEDISDTCEVTVRYTPGQWLIMVLLFGWLWY